MAVAPETWPAPFQSLIRTSNKYLLNPLMLRLAGKRFWYASVVEHTGRRSGKKYRTPVVADRAGDHIYIPLPYGTDVDWLRNVLANGSAEVVSHGRKYRVTAPALVGPAETLPELPANRRTTFTRLSIQHFLRTDVVPN